MNCRQSFYFNNFLIGKYLARQGVLKCQMECDAVIHRGLFPGAVEAKFIETEISVPQFFGLPGRKNPLTNALRAMRYS